MKRLTNCVMCGAEIVPPQMRYCSPACDRARRAAAARERRAQNPEEFRRRTRESMQRTRDRRGPHHRSLSKRKDIYGIDSATYLAMLDGQRWQCAICRDPIDVRSAHVDHDHACCSGRTSCGECIRGLLCRRCNALLGMALDQTRRLRRAVRYLEEG